MHLREGDARGRHKIQNRRSAVISRVLKAPTVGGAIYTIAPGDNLQKVKYVHRDMLKAHIGPVTAVHSPMAQSSCPIAELADDSNDGDVRLLVLETTSSPTPCPTGH